MDLISSPDRLTLTPIVNTQLVNALFGFLEKFCPAWVVPMLEAVRLEIDSMLPSLSAFLAMRGVSSLSLTGDDLKGWVDGVFAWMESKLGSRPLVLFVLKTLNGIVDTTGLPALAAYLKSLGILSA